ncbi:MAG TPA: alpha/beta hydrolase [Planctomycetota bacterium]|nr:alpha/beta hydrolase [Planctomycetota bacterium]
MRTVALALLVAAGCASPEETGDMSWFSKWPETGADALDPKLRSALEVQGPQPDFRGQPLAEVRANFDTMAARLPKLNEKLAKVETREVGACRVRVYTPEGRGSWPALLYLHGGGWVLGDLESHDDVCRSLANRTPCVVVSVDYRRSPESKYPVPLDDCETALRWLVEHAAELDVDPARVAVGGDSAGGNLAAGLAIRMRQKGGPRIAYQLLIYPATDRSVGRDSHREFASGFGLSRSNMQWFWDCYLTETAERDNPEISPLRVKILKGLPPAFVLTAHSDVLRDEGEEFARRLHEAGVPVRAVRFRAMNHGFIRMGAVFPQADHGLTVLAEALRSIPR